MMPTDSPIVHYYTFEVNSPSSREVIAIPDGCVDILFSISQTDARGYVYGMVRENTKIQLDPGNCYFGVRFVPGYLPKRLDIRIPELVSNCIPLSDFTGGTELIEQIGLANDFSERIGLLETFVGGEWRTMELLQSIIEIILKTSGTLRMSDIEEKTLYTARYISKVFSQNLGISPKEFSDHMRFQNLISRLNNGGGERSLTCLAMESGYYDQSHFNREFKRFTAMTPKQYSAAVDIANYNKKIIYLNPSM
jgi:AraC-like DNA-binding protein